MKRRIWHYLPLLVLCILFSLLMANLLITRQYDRTMEKSDTLVQELFDYIRESNTRRLSKIEEENQTHITRVQNSLKLTAGVLQKAGLSSANLGDEEDPSFQMTDSLLEEDDFSETVLLVKTDGTILMQWTSDDSWVPSLTEKNIKDALKLSEESWKTLCTGNAEEYADVKSVSGALSYNGYEETMTCLAQHVSGSDLVLVYAENESVSALRGINYTSLEYVNNLDDDVSFLCIRQSDGILLNTVEFSSDFEYIVSADVLGVTQPMMQEGYHGLLTIQDTEYILDTMVISDQNGAAVSVIALRSSSVLVRTDSIIWAAIIFFAISMLFTLYALFVKFSHEARTSQKVFHLFGRLCIQRLVLKKLLPIALVCILLVLAFGYVSTTVCNLDKAMETVAVRQKSILSDIQNVYQMEQFSQDYTAKDLRRQVRLLGGYLSFHANQIFDKDQYSSVIPYYYTDSGSQKNLPLTDMNGNAVECVAGSKILDEARNILGFMSLSIYNLDGAAILTTETSQPKRIENDDPLMKVLLRKENSLVIGNEDYHTQTIAIPFNLYTIDCENNEIDYITEEDYEAYLEEGSYSVHCIPVMICATRSCDFEELNTNSQSIGYELENSSTGQYSYMLFDNNEEHTALYLPEELQGETVKSMKLPESLLQGTHYAIQKISGKEYLLYSSKVSIPDTDESYWLVTLISSNTIHAQRLQNVLYTGFATLIFLVLILLLIPLKWKQRTNPATEENEAEIFHLNQKINWQQKSPEKKALFLCSLCMDALGIYVAITAFTLAQAGNINCVLGWLISMNWDRGFNLFSLLSIGLLFLWTHLAKQILSGLMTALKSVSYGRAETCLRLLVSVCRYAMSLACVFFGLYLLGLNAMSVLTSLGVFSMLLGLGANKLFGDIIAGVFMVVEGEIQVGDIVTIGNFCGKVTEIGIRTTKIQNLDGNVTILTNSSIVSVLNMTRHTSRVKIDLAVNKSVPIDTVEKCLADILPSISAECKIPHENLEYLGVDQISGANNNYRVECSCAEYLRNSLFRYLNRVLSMELKKNNITLS